MKIRSLVAVFCISLIFAVGFVLPAAAASGVAVVNLQKVLEKSKAGMSAKSKMDKKMKQLKAELEKEKKALLALQDEIKKKASAWSEEKKQEKGIEMQRKTRDFRVKQDDANIEMRKLQEQYLAPIMKKLEGVVKDVATKKGISVMLPNTAVLYSDPSVDMTEDVTKALNAKM
ncbi:MAG: OmpH family outer membrane protein [Candidatus Electrothrix sp. YB6]